MLTLLALLSQYLESLNRKERFFLTGLRQVVGLNVPHDAFAAMDYHLDWMHVALLLRCDNNRCDNNGRRSSTGGFFRVYRKAQRPEQE